MQHIHLTTQKRGENHGADRSAYAFFRQHGWRDSPRGLAELCCQEGVTLAALTDHNDIAGSAEFIWRSAQLGVQAIPGVELDCVHEGNLLHMLGYGIDIANEALLHAVQAVRGLQAEAGMRLMDAVAAQGHRV